MMKKSVGRPRAKDKIRKEQSNSSTFTRPRTCLICCDKKIISKNRGKSSSILEQQVFVIYVVNKLLDIPLEICSGYLEKYGHPEEWIWLCDECRSVVAETEEIWRKVKRLEKQHRSMQEQIRLRMKVKREVTLSDDDIPDSYVDLGREGAASDIRLYLETIEDLTEADNDGKSYLDVTPVDTWDSHGFEMEEISVPPSIKILHPDFDTVEDTETMEYVARTDDDMDFHFEGDNNCDSDPEWELNEPTNESRVTSGRSRSDPKYRANSSTPTSYPMCLCNEQNREGIYTKHKTLTLEQVLKLREEMIKSIPPRVEEATPEQRLERRFRQNQIYLARLCKVHKVTKFPCLTQGCQQVFKSYSKWKFHQEVEKCGAEGRTTRPWLYEEPEPTTSTPHGNGTSESGGNLPDSESGSRDERSLKTPRFKRGKYRRKNNPKTFAEVCALRERLLPTIPALSANATMKEKVERRNFQNNITLARLCPKYQVSEFPCSDENCDEVLKSYEEWKEHVDLHKTRGTDRSGGSSTPKTTTKEKTEQYSRLRSPRVIKRIKKEDSDSGDSASENSDRDFAPEENDSDSDFVPEPSSLASTSKRRHKKSLLGEVVSVKVEMKTFEEVCKLRETFLESIPPKRDDMPQEELLSRRLLQNRYHLNRICRRNKVSEFPCANKTSGKVFKTYKEWRMHVHKERCEDCLPALATDAKSVRKLDDTASKPIQIRKPKQKRVEASAKVKEADADADIGPKKEHDDPADPFGHDPSDCEAAGLNSDPEWNDDETQAETGEDEEDSGSGFAPKRKSTSVKRTKSPQRNRNPLMKLIPRRTRLPKLSFEEVIKRREQLIAELPPVDQNSTPEHKREVKRRRTNIALRILVVRHRVTEFPCLSKECDKIFPNYSQWFDHSEVKRCGTLVGLKGLGVTESEVVAEGVKCDTCGKSVGNVRVLEDHFRTAHTPVASLSCSACSLSCKKIYDFNKHITDSAEGSECRRGAIKCSRSGCKALLSTKEVLDLHMKIRHINTLPNTYKCLKCDTTFPDKGTLKKHLPVHDPQPSFVCDRCGASFFKRDRLRTHVKQVHLVKNPELNMKKWPCRYCGKVFLVKNRVQRHEKLHRKESPYLCTICGKRFKICNYLTLHMWSHDPDRKEKYSLYKPRPHYKRKPGPKRSWRVKDVPVKDDDEVEGEMGESMEEPGPGNSVSVDVNVDMLDMDSVDQFEDAQL